MLSHLLDLQGHELPESLVWAFILQTSSEVDSLPPAWVPQCCPCFATHQPLTPVSIDTVYPLQPLCELSKLTSTLQRPGRGLSPAYRALASPPPWPPSPLFCACYSLLNRSVLSLFHAEQLHQLHGNLGNRSPISPGYTCYSRLIKVKPNTVGLPLAKSFACCKENTFFLCLIIPVFPVTDVGPDLK